MPIGIEIVFSLLICRGSLVELVLKSRMKTKNIKNNGVIKAKATIKAKSCVGLIKESLIKGSPHSPQTLTPSNLLF
tara:strand:+ start:584 stop:811 length:228 start_codon:yes stop_codon:yes gene_type:complete